MNIRQAKEEIKRTVEIYLEKNQYGEYVIPYHKQRPVYMVGAPGIGKTAIMEQIAQELDVALVSYSMSHHTRQSALGLPHIVEKTYNGETMQISEYTLSEIIAKVYDTMEKSNIREGILFLDEINCVSETLAPAMLQFLQYKIFGNHPMPEGWIIVTAGNPPQYNKSVKEFDIATQDRLRILSIEEDYEVWRNYASEVQVHGAILAFLESNREYFYRIRTTSQGKVFVTARGWEDLSAVIRLYEKKGFPVESTMIAQYITDQEVSRKFSMFYDLYTRYHQDYHVEEILSGKVTNDIIAKASHAPFEERISLLEMVFDRMGSDFVENLQEENILSMVVASLRKVKASLTASAGEINPLLQSHIDSLTKEWNERKAANNLSQEQATIYRGSIDTLYGYQNDKKIATSALGTQFPEVKKLFQARVKRHNASITKTQKELESVFTFVEKAWGTSQELTLLMTFLTGNRYSNTFINRWGSKPYFKYNKDMLIYDAKKALLAQIEDLNLDDEEDEKKQAEKKA